MKKECAILPVLIVLLSCSDRVDTNFVIEHKNEVNSEYKQSDENDKIKDSLLLIPLNQLYTDKTIQYIKQEEYVLVSNYLVMGFIVKDNQIILGSNEQKGLFSFDLSTSNLAELTKSKLPLISEEDAINTLFLVGNELYASTYWDNYLFEVNNWTLKKQMGKSFDKRSVDFVRVINKNVLSSFVDLSPVLKQNLSEYLIKPGYDQALTTNNTHVVVLANQSENYILLLKCTPSGAIKSLKINFDEENINMYNDVDIIYLSNQEVKFVLKTSFPEDHPDILISYDFTKETVKNTQPLNTFFKEPTIFGDPVAFPTGSSYFYDSKRLWRMRTTNKGLCFENWKNIM